MHVLHLAWEYPPRLFGGLGRHVHGLVGALAQSGTQVTVATPHLRIDDGPEDPSTPRIRVLRAATPAAPLPPEQWIGEVLQANSAMADFVLDAEVMPDVIHAHDWMTGPAARRLAGHLDVPLVVTIHATERGRHMGFLPAGVSAWIDDRERELVSLATDVIVCAAGMMKAVSELGATDAQVIGNGIHASAWSVPTTRRRRRIVVAGRLEYEKGVQVLLAATRGLDVEVVVAGTGSHLPELTKDAHSRVRFVGHLRQPELAALLNTATIVAVPSLYEPFGLAAREAMAAGARVILSHTGGLADLADANLAIGVPPDDAPALRRAIVELLSDVTARRTLADRGRDHVRGLDWQSSGRSHAQVYERRTAGSALAQ